MYFYTYLLQILQILHAKIDCSQNYCVHNVFRWKLYPLDGFIYESKVTELRFTKQKIIIIKNKTKQKQI